MGRLRYDGTSEPINVEDVTLAHLKVVISAKLRRNESFMMTWRPVNNAETRRATAWIHPAIPLQLLFDNAAPPAIDPDRIAHMMHSLNATGELVLGEVADD